MTTRPDEDIHFVHPRNLIVVAGSLWEDERVTDIDYTDAEHAGDSDLDPGETLTAAEIVANHENTMIAVRSIGLTEYPADIDGDNVNENALEYKYEVRPSSPTDTYNKLPGMDSTLSLGQISKSEEIIPGAYVGPIKSFRVRVTNRSNRFSNPVSVPVDEIGCHIHARVIRQGQMPETPVHGDFEVEVAMDDGGE